LGEGVEKKDGFDGTMMELKEKEEKEIVNEEEAKLE